MSYPVDVNSSNPFTAALSERYAINAMKFAGSATFKYAEACGLIAKLCGGATMPSALELANRARMDMSPIVLVTRDYDYDGVGFGFRMMPRFTFAVSAHNFVCDEEVSSLEKVQAEYGHMLRLRWTDMEDGTFYQSRFFGNGIDDEYETTSDLNEAHWIEQQEATYVS